jgi:uncharacterized membrane protein YhaH (DUF805 family)
MGIVEAVKSCFNNYITFSGRARRSEYWYFVLFSIIGSIALGLVDRAIFGAAVETIDMGDGGYMMQRPGLLESLFSLAILLPTISVAVRRLHDTGRSGWWLLIGLIPLIGWIVLLVWYVSRGTVGDNEYGPDPLSDGGSPYSSIPNVPRS